MERDVMRHALQLEMLERNSALGDEAATGLLRSEFALAQNAGYFDALSLEDLEVDVTSRSTPQEGVTRYGVQLLIEERAVTLDDDATAELLRQAFAAALNASYFLRVCTDDHITVTLMAREPVGAPALRSAA